jgi:hypothetical protein
MSLLRRSHSDHHHTATKGASLAKGPALTIGILLVAAGILGMTADGTTPPGSNFPDGRALGSEFLGVETNGWTNVLLVGSGALLLLGAAKHWGAKLTSLLVGLALLAAAAFSFFNDDILGLGASNGWTELLLAAAGAALLITALLPRLGHKDHHRDHVDDLPKTLTGKIRRIELRERERSGSGQTTS